MRKFSSAAADNLEELLQAKLDDQQLATMQAYINKRVVEEALGLTNILQMERPDPMRTMMTTSPVQRAILGAQLNNEVEGLGSNPIIVEQYARYKALNSLLAIKDARAAHAIDTDLEKTLHEIDNLPLTHKRGVL